MIAWSTEGKLLGLTFVRMGSSQTKCRHKRILVRREPA